MINNRRGERETVRWRDGHGCCSNNGHWMDIPREMPKLNCEYRAGDLGPYMPMIRRPRCGKRQGEHVSSNATVLLEKDWMLGCVNKNKCIQRPAPCRSSTREERTLQRLHRLPACLDCMGLQKLASRILVGLQTALAFNQLIESRGHQILYNLI